jgi:isochorismate synthase
LAGTIPDMGIPLPDVKWREKESHEQHVIETFIEGKLEDEGLPYSKRGPRTVRAGSMLHLCTDYFLKDNQNALKIAALLHPGPAICGLPQSLAQEWIGTYEEHDRQDYCGYIGPWKIPRRNNNAEVYSALFINLRSMTIWKDAFLLYLGGGLTAMSEARAEWDETELKASTMMSVIVEKAPV